MTRMPGAELVLALRRGHYQTRRNEASRQAFDRLEGHAR